MEENQQPVTDQREEMAMDSPHAKETKCSYWEFGTVVESPESEETWVPKKHKQEDCKEEVNESGKTWSENKEAGQQ